MVEYSLLDNNIKIITDTLKTVESVSIYVMVKVGSRYEDKKINGISHFLEHMAFKGTKARSAKQIAEEFDNIGGYFNAYTSREVTVYHVKILKDKEYISFVLNILADILINSVFDEKELEKERLVVAQEIARTNDSPDDIIFDKHNENAYRNQSFGRSVLGLPEVVNKLSRDDLVEYVDRHYFSGNIMIAFSGNIEHEDAVRAIKESSPSFLQIKNKEKFAVKPAEYTGGDYREHRDLEQTHVLIGFPGVTYNDDMYYKMRLFSMILGGGMSSRLFQEVREKRGLAYSVFAFHSSYLDTGLFSIYSAVNSSNLHDFCSIALGEIGSIASRGITAEELVRVKRQLKAGLLMEMESTEARASRALQSFVYYGRYIGLDELVRQVDVVTQDDIKQCALSLLSNKQKIAFTAIGDINKMPAYNDLPNLL